MLEKKKKNPFCCQVLFPDSLVMIFSKHVFSIVSISYAYYYQTSYCLPLLFPSQTQILCRYCQFFGVLSPFFFFGIQGLWECLVLYGSSLKQMSVNFSLYLDTLHDYLGSGKNYVATTFPEYFFSNGIRIGREIVSISLLLYFQAFQSFCLGLLVSSMTSMTNIQLMHSHSMTDNTVTKNNIFWIFIAISLLYVILHFPFLFSLSFQIVSYYFQGDIYNFQSSIAFLEQLTKIYLCSSSAYP